MTGNKYIVSAKNSDISLEFQYDLKGRLISFKLNGEPSLTQYQWIFDKMPLKETDIDTYKKRPENFNLDEVPTDLSFKNFWNTYAYKVGKKKMAENTWNKLGDDKRIKALSYINRYRQHCNSTQTQMAHASTYLNQEYYDN